ncbi:hypothetical protein GCM10010178_75870 [Lentzea flava]|uniref:Uncharacterized protein n=1 Tax=Lentzea flava TaxID=103732 RepID=A0ABQ2V7Q1_9PSEU|nr:hypothetical protein GCM10010178_75870 [Lentzea flava]
MPAKVGADRHGQHPAPHCTNNLCVLKALKRVGAWRKKPPTPLYQAPAEGAEDVDRTSAGEGNGNSKPTSTAPSEPSPTTPSEPSPTAPSEPSSADEEGSDR